LSVSKLPLKCAVVSLYSVAKKRLKCNTGKVFNCLIQFLLAMFLSTGERVFLVECVFREGNRYTGLMLEQFTEKYPETPVHHRSAFRRLIKKFYETDSVLDAVDITSNTFCKCTATFRTHSITGSSVHISVNLRRVRLTNVAVKSQ
jgi:hypothetical protein